MYRVHVSLCQFGQSRWGEGGFCTPPKIGMCSLLTELWRDSDFRARSDYPLPFLVNSYQVTRILYSIHYDDDSQTICCVISFQCLQRVSKLLCTSVSIHQSINCDLYSILVFMSINLPAPPQKNWQQFRNCQEGPSVIWDEEGTSGTWTQGWPAHKPPRCGHLMIGFSRS